jgi:hypothetical protein
MYVACLLRILVWVWAVDQVKDTVEFTVAQLAMGMCESSPMHCGSD